MYFVVVQQLLKWILIGGLSSFSFALELLDSKGRVDVRIGAEATWHAPQKSTSNASLYVRLQKQAYVNLKLEKDGSINLQGPAQAHLLEIPRSSGDGKELHVDEFQGALLLKKDSSLALASVACGDWVIETSKGHFQAICQRDHLGLLVRMVSGQAFVTKRNGQTVALDSAKMWRVFENQEHFLDQNQYARWAGDWAMLAQQNSPWNLQHQAQSPLAPLWKAGNFLVQALGPLQDVPWGKLQTELDLDSLTIVNRGAEWDLRLHMSVTMWEQDRPFAKQTRQFHFEKSLANAGENGFDFLTTLTLDAKNPLVMASVWGEISREWLAWVRKNVADPMARNGY